MKKIKLQRPNERFNKNNSYEIFVGKRKLTELKNGEEKIIEIPNELKNNDLRAKIQWCGSEKLNMNSLKENDTLKVSGNSFLNGKSIFIIALIPLTGVLMFGYGRESTITKYLGIGLFISILLFVMLALTIGRNKWLRIEKRN